MSLPVIITHHAQRNMLERQVTRAEVVDTIDNFQNRYAATTHRGRATPDRFVYQKGNIAVIAVVKPDEILVVTVLLKTPELWTDADARNRERTPMPG